MNNINLSAVATFVGAPPAKRNDHKTTMYDPTGASVRLYKIELLEKNIEMKDREIAGMKG